jgi:hypothetical protein
LAGAGWAAGVSSFYTWIELAGAAGWTVAVHSAFHTCTGGQFTNKVARAVGIAGTHRAISTCVVGETFKPSIAVFIHQAVHTGASGQVAKKSDRAVIVVATGFGLRLGRGGRIFLADTGVTNFVEFAVRVGRAISRCRGFGGFAAVTVWASRIDVSSATSAQGKADEKERKW